MKRSSRYWEVRQDLLISGKKHFLKRGTRYSSKFGQAMVQITVCLG